jgi:Xaa-Pro aminopeptidase
MQDEYKRRIHRIRRQLRTIKVNGLIVIGTANVQYLTGFTGHDSWALVLPRSVVLLTDSRYTEQAEGECVNCRIIERSIGLAKAVESVVFRSKSVKTLAVEDTCSLAVLKGLRKTLSVKIKPVARVVENVRWIKTDAEVKLICKAATIAFNAMDRALKQLNLGMTERQFAALYEYLLSEYGATPSFETIAAFGPNGSRNHHQPGTRKLKKNDTILLDFGARYQGYCSDITRCYAVGKATRLFKKAYEAVACAQRAAIEQIKPNQQGENIDQTARHIIEQFNLPAYGHGLGHGLGLEVHESPVLSRTDKKGKLVTGHVLTVEPGVYLPGKFGIRLEDDVLVTNRGTRILTDDQRFKIDPDQVPLLKV